MAMVGGIGCDECGCELDDGAEVVVVVHEDDSRLHVAHARAGSSDADDLLILFDLRFHPDCYELARAKQPPLPPLDSSGEPARPRPPLLAGLGPRTLALVGVPCKPLRGSSSRQPLV